MSNSQPNNSKVPTPMGARPEPDAYAEAFEGAAYAAYTPSLREYFGIIRKRLWVIALVTTIFVGITMGFTLMQTPVYEASTKILIGQDQGSATRYNSLQSEVEGLQRLTQTMAEAVSTRPIAEAVIQQLDLQMTPEDFQKNLNAKQIRTTQFIQVDYRATSATRAQQVANSVGNNFSQQISVVGPIPNAVTAIVWEPAEVPDEPVSPKPVRNGFLALALGAIMGVGLAFLLEYLDDSRRSLEEVERVSGSPDGANPGARGYDGQEEG